MHLQVVLFLFQFAFGVIPNIRAKGVASSKAAELLNNMQLEDPVNMDNVMPTDFKILLLRSLNSADRLNFSGAFRWGRQR
jgi:hypothetical protein